ncbi:MAG: hypothetical protein R2780_02165 [Crocinitomicaceae bacterium]|nr:hypothetical protein [Crocinitomicaceae bacterium]
MKHLILISVLGVIIGCTEEFPVYTVDFTTNVVVDSCYSININVESMIHEDVLADQRGVLVSSCPSPKLTDPNGTESNCFEMPDILVTDSDSSHYSFQIHSLYNAGGSLFDPTRIYYTRPFLVIQNTPYYGQTVEFGCE